MVYARAIKSLKEEGCDILRGSAGGLIFGTPLLFTMEMWFHGMEITPDHLLGIVLFVSLINIGFSYASGLRRHNQDHNLIAAIADSITAFAIGLIIATIILGLIGQLNSGDNWDIVSGKIILEACAVSIGMTFTNAKFPKERKEDKSSNYKELENSPLSKEQKQARLDFYNMAAVVGGAVIFSFNVAPTEEVVVIATAQTPLSLLVLALSQLFFCYVILYAANFKEKKVFKKTAMQSPAAEIMMTVALAWIVSAIMILFMGVEDTKVDMDTFIACVITLGFTATIGGAAGKIVV